MYSLLTLRNTTVHCEKETYCYNTLFVCPRCLPNASELNGTTGDLDSKLFLMVVVVLAFVVVFVWFGGFWFWRLFTPERTFSAISLPLHFSLYWDEGKQVSVSFVSLHSLWAFCNLKKDKNLL